MGDEFNVEIDTPPEKGRRVKISTTIRSLHPREVFRISRAARTEVRNVFLRIEAGGIVGIGEASPNAFYEETPEAVEERLGRVGELLGDLPESTADIEELWRRSWQMLAPSRAAQCALDLALWDWLGKRQGIPVAELALGQPARPVESFCTIGICSPEELAARAAGFREHSLIKIKSDAQAQLGPVRTVRSWGDARLAVDANCAWADVDLAPLSRELSSLGVEFIEQPLHPSEDFRMQGLLAESALPLVADESCVTLENVEAMPGRFSGFNVKLVKCGGLTPALQMLARGRELGLLTMVGCMLESSLLIAAGAVAAQKSDYADLDGAWLLADDPSTGVGFERGLLRLSGAPGLGCEVHL